MIPPDEWARIHAVQGRIQAVQGTRRDVAEPAYAALCNAILAYAVAERRGGRLDCLTAAVRALAGALDDLAPEAGGRRG